MFSFLRKICFANFRRDKELPQTQLLSSNNTPRFKHLKLAGRGGFGCVYKSEDALLDRIVAEKVIFTQKQNLKQRAQREAKILAKLSHPNIPAIYDIIFSEQSISIIFEWIDGITLAEQIKNNSLSIESVLPFFKDLCSALDFAHSNNIYHRDIKPSNIIIRNGNNSCVLVDFGIATDKKTADDITRAGETLGTPGYMAPEQEAGGNINQTTDIYSLAIVLYECLAGERFPTSGYRELSKINPEIPEPVDDIIKLCLEKSQEKRIQTAKNFYQRLLNAFSNQSTSDIYQIWAKGSLKEICESLQRMDVVIFKRIPAGDRAILFNRIKDLILYDSYKMRNHLAKLLCVLLNLCYDEDFSFYIKAALNFAFVVEYSPNWFGNPELRKKYLKLFLTLLIKTFKLLLRRYPLLFQKYPQSRWLIT